MSFTSAVMFPILMGFQGTTKFDPQVQEIAKALHEGLLAGVILFSGNIQNPEQVKELTTFFHQCCDTPPLIAIDQEGGRVQRLSSKNGFEDFLSAQEVAHRYTVDEAYDYYTKMAIQTKMAGFNYVLGPVVDLHDEASPAIGGMGRSYSADPEKVALYASAFIKAHQNQGLLTSLKHFPGHGKAKGDTHHGLVDVTLTYDTKELVPFDLLIKDGMVDSIMTAHVLNKQWDDQWPATLSPLILQDILRKKMQYQGVIVTDDLHMGALQAMANVEDIIEKAILAGNDLLIFSNNPLARKGMPEEDSFDICEKGLIPSFTKLQQNWPKDSIFHDLVEKANKSVLSLRSKISSTMD